MKTIYRVYNLEYEKYLKEKEGTKYSFTRFYELRQSLSFEEVLNRTHRYDLPANSGPKLTRTPKYSDRYISRIGEQFRYGERVKDIAYYNNLTIYAVKHIIRKYQKLSGYSSHVNNRKEEYEKYCSLGGTRCFSTFCFHRYSSGKSLEEVLKLKHKTKR